MNANTLINKKIQASWMMLKITYGALFVIAGIDKFFNLVTNWAQYLNPLILNTLPITTSQLLMAIAVVEVIIGIMILTNFTKAGAYLAAIWLLIIAINLVSMFTFYDIAVRDIVMAVGAVVLANLSEIHHMVYKK